MANRDLAMQIPNQDIHRSMKRLGWAAPFPTQREEGRGEGLRPFRCGNLPEKAVLDLIHLEPGADSPGYLQELRLQHLESLDLEVLKRLAEASGRPKLRRAAERIARV